MLLHVSLQHPFETAGAVIGSKDIEKMLTNPDILYLAEMMNYPGVLFNDPEVIAKIAELKKLVNPLMVMLRDFAVMMQ